MKHSFNCLIAAVVLFSFSCKGQGNDKPEQGKVMVDVNELIKNEKPVSIENGTEYYNKFQIAATVKLRRAFLVFDDGTRVPPDNKVDFSKDVMLILQIDSGWAVKDNKVYLEGSVQAYDNAAGNAKFLDIKLNEVLDNGLSPTDAQTLSIKVKDFKNVTGNVSVTFGFKDKINGRYVGGAFRLYNTKN